MENTQQIQVEQPPIQDLNQAPKPKKSNFLSILLIIIGFILAGMTGYFIGKNNKMVVSMDTPSNTIAQKEVPTQAPEAIIENIRVLTHINKDPKFTLEYYADWQIDASNSEQKDVNHSPKLTITKNNHTLIISRPSTWGPSICVFDGDPEPFLGEMEISSMGPLFKIANKTIAFERSLSPSIDPDLNLATWSICENINTLVNEHNYSVIAITSIGGGSSIQYRTPGEFNQKLISEMDEILKTLKTK